jgi:hypothetical protein
MSKRKLYVVAGIAAAGAFAGGGAALATAADDHSVGGAKADHARAAAAAYLGGGRAGSVERDGEHGATYDVEVHQPGGAVIDVWLDSAFKPVASERDEESSN